MKKFAGVIFAFLGTFAIAIPPKASFNSMKKLDGDTLLHFTINQQKITLIDDDGVGTLATLQYVLIQNPSEALYLKKSKWENVRNEAVEGWNKNVKAAYLEALNRAKIVYLKNGKKKGAQELEQIILKLEKLELLQKSPTYEDLNEIGKWLNENAINHSYTMKVIEKDKEEQIQKGQRLIDNSSDNPLGTALSGRGFTLPTRFLLRSRAVFVVDLETIVTRYNSSRFNKEEGQKKAEPSKKYTH